ncbi:MAG: class I SAM-dependent methyltransferase [Jatrophihabitans sp.]
MDNWIVATLGNTLRAATEPLVVDLGYGATPITAVELASRLRTVRPDVRVLGLEIDPERVAAAAAAADPPRLRFARGGFELAGQAPVLVRAANVLRQYDEDAANDAWQMMCACLGPGGLLVEGTCDEIGRRGSWVLLDEFGPRTLTFAAKLATLERPSDLAERLPKALIHRNVPGESIHDLLRALDSAWDATAAMSAFGPRQHWTAACSHVAETGWPVDASRARHGELTVPWSAVAAR